MKTLPIHAVEKELVETLNGNQVVVVTAATGSGKTTEIPQILYRAGFAQFGTIVVTEPRRIAATSVAEYVADQMGIRLGDKVGYQVRFDDCSSERVAIKFVTDGVLIAGMQRDPMFMNAGVIMIDEAHERSVNIDLVLGLVRRALKRRPDLKVVIASATINARKFADYFGGAPIIDVPGKVYPVETFWPEHDFDPFELTEEVVRKVEEIHRMKPKGDILVFLPGEREITAVVRELERNQHLAVFPAYGQLPSHELRKIFRRTGKRKVVVATNIAETSITIEGVRYVIDSGLIKRSGFDADTGIGSLNVEEHSQSGCDQRKGRAGRTSPGQYHPLFTQASYMQRLHHSEPEICRSSLASVVLTMESLGIKDVQNFEFMDAPNPTAFKEAYDTLVMLGAIDGTAKKITEVGRKMARLPLDPRMARMLIEAEKHHCGMDVAIIAAFMSVGNVFVRPRGEEGKADKAHSEFKNGSDFSTFLNVWKAYVASGFNYRWCRERFLHGKNLEEIKKVREQLCSILGGMGVETRSGGDIKAIEQCVISGLISNLFGKTGGHAYVTIGREGSSIEEVFVHRSSVLFHQKPLFLVALEVTSSGGKNSARNCCAVPPELLTVLRPDLFEKQLPIVKSVDWSGGKAMAEARIIFHDRTLGTTSDVGRASWKASLGEAAEIQAAAIRDAEAKGLLKGRFLRRVQGEWKTYEGQPLVCYTPVEPNELYYCEEATHEENVSRFLRRFKSMPTLVIPKFRVFDFGKLKLKPEQKTGAPVKLTVAEQKPKDPSRSETSPEGGVDLSSLNGLGAHLVMKV
jgi:HrpA-like RNA helicase